eukprot:m.114561 g.114561  ORF g.114561 m.114561 type:complete len:179 (+) comp14171_c1_seq1:294-830(+)
METEIVMDGIVADLGRELDEAEKVLGVPREQARGKDGTKDDELKALGIHTVHQEELEENIQNEMDKLIEKQDKQYEGAKIKRELNLLHRVIKSLKADREEVDQKVAQCMRKGGREYDLTLLQSLQSEQKRLSKRILDEKDRERQFISRFAEISKQTYTRSNKPKQNQWLFMEEALVSQ